MCNSARKWHENGLFWWMDLLDGYVPSPGKCWGKELLLSCMLEFAPLPLRLSPFSPHPLPPRRHRPPSPLCATDGDGWGEFQRSVFVGWNIVVVPGIIGCVPPGVWHRRRQWRRSRRRSRSRGVGEERGHGLRIGLRLRQWIWHWIRPRVGNRVLFDGRPHPPALRPPA